MKADMDKESAFNSIQIQLGLHIDRPVRELVNTHTHTHTHTHTSSPKPTLAYACMREFGAGNNGMQGRNHRRCDADRGAHQKAMVGVAAVPGKPGQAEHQAAPGGADEEGGPLEHHGRDPPHSIRLQEVALEEVGCVAASSQEGLARDGCPHGGKLGEELHNLEEALRQAGHQARDEVVSIA